MQYGTLPVYSNDHNALRTGSPAALRHAMVTARDRTLMLAKAYASALGPAMAVPHRPGLNPPLWELGHIAWFQDYWLGRNAARSEGARLETTRRAPSLLQGADALYDSSNVAHATRWSLPLPDFGATLGYLARVLERSLAHIDALPQDAGDDDLYFFRLTAMHEEMHAEAAIYMARALGIDVPRTLLTTPVHRSNDNRTIRIPARLFTLGWQGGGFAFDNELHAHEVALHAVDIDAHAVSWRRFMPFVEAGGYRDARWWDEAGARWLRGTPGQHMRLREQEVQQRATDPDAAAVHLTAHEARAWCRWAGRRLPTEAEWECAAVTSSAFHWGEVWEWTASPFLPYRGFRPHPYRDYSAPWFGSRVVLRGACAATSPALAHPRYRNFFEPQRSDIFAGFRSCADAARPAAV